ncbi:hypothetical protein ACJ72_01579 [Emergomyces africanus]|uniref:Myb-like domain-containing protein n=1 Tax=Emergomyces africanus TaxID=1955775 RepID=A0A1B7P4T0_9EURO|nr:hypothetical protein ACJ72_01579 [Emergomyces africanus]
MISRPPVEPGPSLPLTESAGEVALDLSDEIGMDFPGVTLEEDTDGSASNAHWSNSGLLNVFDEALLSGPDDYFNNTNQVDRRRQGTHVSPLQHPDESDSVKEPTVSSLTSLGDENFTVAEANESKNKTVPSEFADSAKVKSRILQASSTSVSTAGKKHLNTTTNEHALSSTDEKNHDPASGLVSGDFSSSTGDVEVGPDELRLKSPVCTNSDGIPSEERGGHLIAERCESIQAEANEAELTDAENELPHKEIKIPPISCEPNRIRSSERPISISPISQHGGELSKCNRTDTDANFPSVSELQSIVITNPRSRERDMREFSPDGSNDVDDADDVSESSNLSRRSKGATQTAIQSSPTHLRHEKGPRRNVPSRRSISRTSRNEKSHPQALRNQCPISSLSDMETIPIRGFLTREIFLSKVVYSITFEERNESTCSQEPGGTPPYCEREPQRRRLPRRKGSQVGQSNRQPRILSKDDELLIELKEKRGLTWKQIGQYFPKRSVGSLQTAYSRSRREEPCQSSGFSARNVNSMATEGSLRQRYGPPRRRQTVDRYSPV